MLGDEPWVAAKMLITGGGSIAQWLAYLLPNPADPGLNNSFRFFFFEKWFLILQSQLRAHFLLVVNAKLN